MTRAESRRAARRTQILDAAVQVFAQKGFHGCRVSDIAQEAGIAYGLVYHYFQNKESILISIFEEKWAVLLQVLQSIADDQDTSLHDKLSGILKFLFALYKQNQPLAEVILMELIHSKDFRKPELLDRFEWAYRIIQKIFVDAQQNGDLPKGTNTALIPLLFLGNLETLFTGLALQLLPLEDAILDQVIHDTASLYS